MDVKNMILNIVNRDLEARGISRLKTESSPTMIPESLHDRLEELDRLVWQLGTIAQDLSDSFCHLNEVLDREREKK